MTISSEGDFDTILDDDSLEDTTDELDALEELAGKKEKAEDEDEYKNDTDPQGFFTFKKLVSAMPYRPCSLMIISF